MPINHLPVLIVEDDADLREAIMDTLALAGYTSLAASDGRSALHQLNSSSIGLVISDAQMEPMDGYALFSEMRQRFPGIPFILMTAYGAIERAIELLRAGASHYLLKPFEPARLIAEVEKHILTLPGGGNEEDFIAESAAARQLFSLARRVAQSDVTVLLSGPSGAGKEVVARYIHRHSRRSEGPFIAVNCAAIPETLLESILFGHEKGAFTGATQSMPGKFEQAQGGTLLLDEISEMPLLLQAKLLRVLQEREVERVGGKRTVALDIRIVATTNRDIQAEVSAGRFREDLYFRLNVFPLKVLPLAERRDDILPLARRVLKKCTKDAQRPGITLSVEAERELTAYAWGGNVRELENVIQRAVILAAGSEIFAADLMLAGAPAAINLSQDTEKNAWPAGSEDIRSLEKKHILDTLTAVGGVKKLAAEKLGISERTLRYKLQRYREE